MNRFCRDNDGDMMECLISHKNEPEMRQDLKCRAAVEHFQIISLQDYHFSYKFKEACRPFVIRYAMTYNNNNHHNRTSKRRNRSFLFQISHLDLSSPCFFSSSFHDISRLVVLVFFRY